MKRPVKVLLVDDSRLVRERLATLVTELAGAEIVGQAGGVREAIRKIHRLRPQIVVLDISLADGTGLQVLQGMRNRRPFPRIIVLTNFTQAAYREKCLKLGAQYFFDKSAQFEQAVEVIRELSRVTPTASSRRDTSASKNPKGAALTTQSRRGRRAKKEMSVANRLERDLCVLSGFGLYCFVSWAAAGPFLYAGRLLACANHG